MIWLYFQKAMYRPCDLDLWPMKVNIFLCIEYHPINILHKFQNDISSNSWEIKYQNIGRTHTQTDRHTHRQTDRPGENNTSQPPPGGEVKNWRSDMSISVRGSLILHHHYLFFGFQMHINTRLLYSSFINLTSDMRCNWWYKQKMRLNSV